jgi:LPXTG-motif cell wall-anchored protein
MLRKVLVIFAVLALLALVVGSVSAAADAANGKTVWAAKNCKSCHGANGEGKFAMPVAGSTLAAADWVKEVRTPRAAMPAYSATQVTDQDIADMQAYMQTLTKPASFTPTVYTPAANDHPGKVLYNQKGCANCHGGAAEPTAFLKTRFVDQGRPVTAAAVIKQLRTPAANMPMFSATQVTDAQAGQIADWFNTLLAAAPVTTTTTTTTTVAAPVTTTTTAAPATTLPKTGDQFSLWFVVVAGTILAALGLGALAFSRPSA